MDDRTRELLNQAKAAMDVACGEDGEHFLIVHLDREGQITTRTSLHDAHQVALLSTQVTEAILARIVRGTIEEVMEPAPPTVVPDRKDQN